MKKITKELLLKALGRLGELAIEEGVTVELCIYGGAAMLLSYGNRDITKDVDALIRPSETGFRLARTVGVELGLPEGWLNDHVKQYIAPKEGLRDLPWEAPGIRLTAPTASYLLALKALACRRALPGFEGDIADLRFLITKLDISSVAQIQEHIDRYYPDDVISSDDVELLERLIDEVDNDS